AANFQVFGVQGSYNLEGKARYPASFTDGTSNTILFAERLQMCDGEPTAWAYDGASSWTPAFAFTSTGKFQGRARECDPSVPQSPPPGGINAGLADASVRFLSAAISGETWWAACPPAGGEMLGDDW